MLGTGLATAQAQAPSIPGVKAGAPDNGSKIDPSALSGAARDDVDDPARADEQTRHDGEGSDDDLHDAPEGRRPRSVPCWASATP